MRILMLGSGSYKSSLSFRVVALGRELARKGHDISLMVPSADKYNGFKPDRTPQVPGVTVVQPWQFATSSALFNLVPYLFSSLVSILRIRPQLVYLYKPTPITIFGLVPKLLFRTLVVLDLDDLGSEVMKVQGQSGLQAGLVAWCERVALRHADAVVVTSSYLRSVVAKKYPGKPLLVLPNGVDTREYPKLNVSRPRHAIYYFGAINRLELVETMLRALPATVAAIPDVQVYVLGGGSALADAQKLVRRLRLAKHVTFSGWIDMLDAPKYVRYADVAVCYQPDTPTVRAASNMKVFQYMAMGAAVVVSDVGDLAQYVQNGKAGAVVAPDDSRQLAETFVRLLKHPAQRSHMAGQARKLAETTHAWPVLVDTLDVFLQAQAVRRTRQAKLERGYEK
jgi:glycosyltransferase involved in cell wall biosynthesis